MKHLLLLQWLMTHFTVTRPARMSEYRPEVDRRELDLMAFSAEDQRDLSNIFRDDDDEDDSFDEASLNRHWRDLLILLDNLADVEPMSCEVIETRRGYRLVHPAFGLQPPEWCLAQAAGFLRAALACYRRETLERVPEARL